MKIYHHTSAGKRLSMESKRNKVLVRMGDLMGSMDNVSLQLNARRIHIPVVFCNSVPDIELDLMLCSCYMFYMMDW